jgi:predicted secreted protein
MSIFAHGTTFSIASTAVGGLTGISLPDQSRDAVEVTDHGSTGNRDFIPGLRDGGTVTLEGEQRPADAGQLALRTNYEAASTVATCIITLPVTPAVTYTFSGFVTAMGGDNPHDDKATFSASVKVTGAVVRAVAGG